MLASAVTRYSPTFSVRIRIVVNCALGMMPATSPAPIRSIARGPTGVSQYGQILSLIVMKARQCGHMRRVSILLSV